MNCVEVTTSIPYVQTAEAGILFDEEFGDLDETAPDGVAQSRAAGAGTAFLTAYRPGLQGIEVHTLFDEKNVTISVLFSYTAI